MYSFSLFSVGADPSQVLASNHPYTAHVPADAQLTRLLFFWLRRWPDPLEWEPLCKSCSAMRMTTASLEHDRTGDDQTTVKNDFSCGPLSVISTELTPFIERFC